MKVWDYEANDYRELGDGDVTNDECDAKWNSLCPLSMIGPKGPATCHHRCRCCPFEALYNDWDGSPLSIAELVDSACDELDAIRKECGKLELSTYQI